jgi:leucyl-tRNA synthetase
MMELVNACGGQLPARGDAEAFLKILSPYAPHLAEELWSRIGNTEPLLWATWPAWDPDALVSDVVTLAVQVQGKMRGTVEVARTASQEDVVAAALALDTVGRQLEGKELKRVIYVAGRMVNLIVG